MRRPTMGSLFTGIGAIDLGLQWAGVGEVVWQVEIDAWCRGVLAKHWPKAKRHSDVRRVGAEQLERVDIIAGGFPCQDLSVAGKGAGLDGARSGLWREYARIVRELRPQVVVIENVAQLVTRGLDVVVADLDAAGYRVEARIISAADVGAPHQRDRVFVVAHARDDRRSERSEGDYHDGGDAPGDVADGCDSHVANAPREGREGGDERWPKLDEPSRCGQALADADGERVRLEQQRVSGGRPRDVRHGGQGEPFDDGPAGGRQAQPGVGGDAHGPADRVERWPSRPGDPPALWEPMRARKVTTPTTGKRLHALGNAAVPQCLLEVGRLALARWISSAKVSV